MNDDSPLREKFQRLAVALPEQPTLIDSVMRRIEKSSTKPIPRKTRRWFLGATLGTATCIAACFLAWSIPFFALTPSVTFAQVQTALAVQKWMHVIYDNGRESWTTMDGMKRFYIDEEGEISATDQSKNLQMSYCPDSGYISQTMLDGPQKPKTLEEIVGFSMDIPEGEATAKQKATAYYMERFTETLNGRQMVRFDQYQRDVLGESRLQKRIWVDPLTRLPVRMQMFVQLGLRKDPKQEYTFGDYDFPDHGPESIYTLGVPHNLPVVQYSGKSTEGAMKILELAQQACDRFPTSYREIIWSDIWTQPEIDILYRHGADLYKRNEYVPFRSVKSQSSRYFNLEKSRPEYHLPMPATAEQVLVWTQTQRPIAVHVLDGQREYIKTGPTPDFLVNKKPPKLQVFRGDAPPCSGYLWPTECQWPFLTGGPYAFASKEVEPMHGTIVLRSEQGNRRDDYYLDPAHDYICLSQIWWEKRDGLWVKGGENKLFDLKQLPEGQWYAAKKRSLSFANPQRGTLASESTWNVDIQVLGKDEFPPDIFNGEKILEESKKDETIIDAE